MPRKREEPKLPKVVCPYCHQDALLVNSEQVYGPGRDFGMFWMCRPCQAWVGVHKDSPTYTPLGRLADAELRKWKGMVHQALDPLWKTGRVKRFEAYEILAGLLGIPNSKCHVGEFDVETCKRAVHELSQLTTV